MCRVVDSHSEQVLVILRLRWQIERLVPAVERAWPDRRVAQQEAWRILCELYAKLWAMLIQQWLIQLGCWQDPHRSLVKAAQVVRREAGRLMVALYEGQVEVTVVAIVRCMQSGCRLNTRQTRPQHLAVLDWARPWSGPHAPSPRKRA